MSGPASRVLCTTAYVSSIALVNWGFHVVPFWHGWPPISLAVGAVFVLRDFAQREIGHRVALAMLAGAALSWLMADAFVAFASLAAFILSEGAEYLIFTAVKQSFARRVVWSTALATPLDSAVFLALIGAFSPLGVATMTASKMVGAILVWFLIRRRAVAA